MFNDVVYHMTGAPVATYFSQPLRAYCLIAYQPGLERTRLYSTQDGGKRNVMREISALCVQSPVFRELRLFLLVRVQAVPHIYLHACIKLFQIFGVLLVALGAYVQAALSHYFDFTGSPANPAAIVLIVVGVITLVVGFLGCCGAIKENHCMVMTVSTYNCCGHCAVPSSAF